MRGHQADIWRRLTRNYRKRRGSDPKKKSANKKELKGNSRKKTPRRGDGLPTDSREREEVIKGAKVSS